MLWGRKRTYVLTDERGTRDDSRDLEDLIDAKVLYGYRVLSTTGSLRLDNDSDIAMARVLVAMAKY